VLSPSDSELGREKSERRTSVLIALLGDKSDII
jgi:hypothetical protein